MKPNRHEHTAFTLVELPIVIAIMATLAALLLPVLQTARNRSKTGVCLSNLRQLGVAVAQYAADYDDHIPYAPTPMTKERVLRGREVYGEPLDSVIKNLPDVCASLRPYGAIPVSFRCPLDRMDYALLQEGRKPTWFEQWGTSYAYDEEHAFQGRTLSGYPAPAQNWLMSDASPFHGGAFRNPVHGAGETVGMVNVLFADLHAKTLPWEQRTKMVESDP